MNKLKKVISITYQVVLTNFIMLSCALLIGVPIVLFPSIVELMGGRDDWLSIAYPSLFLLIGIIWGVWLSASVLQRRLQYLSENEPIALFIVLFTILFLIGGHFLNLEFNIIWWHGGIIMSCLYIIVLAIVYFIMKRYFKRKREGEIV